MVNSNHSTGPLLPSATTSAGGDHKMVPGAIGSERKRHMAPPTVMNPTVSHPNTSDWSSIPKRKIKELNEDRIFVL